MTEQNDHAERITANQGSVSVYGVADYVGGALLAFGSSRMRCRLMLGGKLRKTPSERAT